MITKLHQVNFLRFKNIKNKQPLASSVLVLIFHRWAAKPLSTLRIAGLIALFFSGGLHSQNDALSNDPLSIEADDSIMIQSPLDPVSIEYKIRISKFGNAILGRVQSSLSTTESGYTIESVTKAQGMALLLMQSNLQESCEFEVVDGRAVARNYTGGTVDKMQYSVGYDWDNRKVNLSDQESLDMPQGYVVDNCIMWFATALLKGNLPEQERIYVVDGKSKRIRGYKLRSKGDETISTSLGDRDTLKVVLERELRPNRTLTFWLSKTDQFLPVRIEESRKSRTTTFEISGMRKA